MNQKEIELVNSDFIKRDDNYNIALGGSGGCSFLGLHHTPETLLIISQKSKETWEDPEYRQNQSDIQKGSIPWNKGLTFDDETKATWKNGGKRPPLTEEHKAKTRATLLGREHSEETKEKMRKPHPRAKGHPTSDETREKLRIKTTDYWARKRADKLAESSTENEFLI